MMDIELSVTGTMNVVGINQQNWRGESDDVMQISTFAGQEMMAIQQSDEEPDLYELHYLGYRCINIKGMALAKSMAPEFARKVLKKIHDMIQLEE